MYEQENKTAKKYNKAADDKLTTEAVALKIALFYKQRQYCKFPDDNILNYIKPPRELFKKGDFYFPDASGNRGLVEFAKKKYLDKCKTRLGTIDIETRKLTEKSLWHELYMYSPSCDLVILIPRQIVVEFGSKPFTKPTYNEETGERTEGEFFVSVPMSKLYFIPLALPVEHMRIYDYATIKLVMQKALFGNVQPLIQTTSFLAPTVKA